MLVEFIFHVQMRNNSGGKTAYVTHFTQENMLMNGKMPGLFFESKLNERKN